VSFHKNDVSFDKLVHNSRYLRESVQSITECFSNKFVRHFLQPPSIDQLQQQQQLQQQLQQLIWRKAKFKSQIKINPTKKITFAYQLSLFIFIFAKLNLISLCPNLSLKRYEMLIEIFKYFSTSIHRNIITYIFFNNSLSKHLTFFHRISHPV